MAPHADQAAPAHRTVDQELTDLVAAGLKDERVAIGLRAFSVASALVPQVVVPEAPVTYSTSANPAV